MRTTNESTPVAGDDQLPLMQAAGVLPGSKDGRGIGDLADAATIDGWVREYFASCEPEADTGLLNLGFRFGVGAEGRYAGLSFVEAEAELRAEWSSEKHQPPWDAVRDSVWSGFDRARDRRV